MSPKFAPPGKTFKERWPRDAAQTSFFTKSSAAFVLGGVLGVLTVPLWIRDQFAAAPFAVAIILGLLVLIVVAIPRGSGSGRDWLVKTWKIGAWIIAAGALGLVIHSITLAICGEACQTAFTEVGRRPSGSAFLYLLLVMGSIGVAVLVDRAGDALRRRAPSPASPR